MERLPLALKPGSCDKCGADAGRLVNITSLTDTRWQYLCLDCGATVAGDPIDPLRAAEQRAQFDAAIAAEARRESLLLDGDPNEKDVLDWIEKASEDE